MSLRKLLEEHQGFILRYQTFADIKDSLEEKYGKEAEVILFSAGIKAGTRSAKRRLETAKNKEHALRLLTSYKEHQNWGIIIFKDINWENHTGKIIVVDTFELRGKKSKKSNSPFLRGFLSGFLSKILKDEINVVIDKSGETRNVKSNFIFHPRIK